MAMLFTRRRIHTLRPVALFGEPIVWVDTTRYLGVTLDKQLTWSTHINQVRKKASQRLGMLGPLLNRSGLSIRNGVLLCRQLIRPMMDYACPVWRSAARCHIRKLQVLQSKCLRIATGALWYMSSRQIHEDLGVPFFADHIRALTDSFDSKLADAGNPLVRQLGRYLTEGWPKSPEAQVMTASRPVEVARETATKSTKRIVSNSLQLGAFRLPRLRFTVIFLSCKANAGV
jgi:hypothetical protein